MSATSKKAVALLKDCAKSNWLPAYHEREIQELNAEMNSNYQILVRLPDIGEKITPT
jgi:hypothetical protein